MTRKLLLPLLALAALALPARATLPRPTAANFAYGVKLTVAGYTNANGKARTTALQNFPVLVRISESAIPGFDYDDVKVDGSDLAFVGMDGAGLPFDIDEWNPSGESLVWVKLPVLTNKAEFVMCYGSSDSGKTVNSDNPFAGYVGVWHMAEPNGTVADSSGNGFVATPSGPAAATDCVAVTGPVGNGRQCSTALGADNLSYLSVPSYDNSKPAGDSFAVSGWVSIASGQTGPDNDARLFSRKEYYTDAHGWEVLWKTASEIRVRGAASSDNIKVTGRYYAGTGWKHVFIVYDGKNSWYYENGAQKGLKTGGTAVTENGRPLGIGGYANDQGSQLLGSVDECRLLDAVPPADWVGAEYGSMADAGFLTAGTVQSYDGSAKPIAYLSMFSVQYTNATASVDLTAFGDGATGADVTIEIAGDAGFSSIVKRETVALASLGTADVRVWGLDYGTTYYVRAFVTNSLDAARDLGPLAFTTLTPGDPAGTAALVPPGYTTLGATATASTFGTGAQSATLRLEASTDGFSTVVAFSEAGARIRTPVALSLTGLSPDTAYDLRVRIRNDWGFETIVPLPPTCTRAEPFAASGLVFSEGAGGTIDFTFPVTGVYDGATVESVLTYDGVAAGTQTTGVPATFSWAGIAAASGTATATVVATATLPNGGGTFTKTWTVSVVPGATATIVANVATYASADGALWVRPGDVVVLPELSGVASYKVLNERFASVDGNMLTALEPGIVGIRCVDANYVTNVMGVVVLPEPIGSGSVYVFKETKHGNNDTACSWPKPECWDKVENGARATSNDSFPQNADDIAILPFYNKTYGFIRHLDNITIGGLYAGMIRPDAEINCVLERYKTATMKTVTFRRTDGQPVEIKVCPNGENGKYSRITLGGFDIDVVWASDAVIDGCSSETDLNGPKGSFRMHNSDTGTCACTNTLVDARLVFRGYPGDTKSGSGCTDYLRGFWRGTGEIVKTGQGGISFPGDFSGFSGTVREMSGPTLGTISAPAAGVLMRAAGASNVVAHVYGWGSYTAGTGAMSYNGLSRGTLGTGGQGVAPVYGAQGPAKGLYMHGGTYRANQISNTSWGKGVADEKAFDVLSVGAGLNYVTEQNGAGNGSGNPINVVTAKTLTQSDRGTLVFYDDSCNRTPRQSVTNNMTKILDWADHAVGAEGDNQAGDVYPVIPWILVNRDDKFNSAHFASFDANGRIVRAVVNDKNLDAYGSEDANAYTTGKGIGLSTDVTVQSLFLNDSGKTRTLGAGRTLTIKSGGLVLQGAGTSIGLASQPNASGSLVLGDATHPAYVWAKSYTGDPNVIWAETTAAGGFVKSWPGNLVLGGNQTGIAVEIAVNGGSLQLGTDAKDCELTEGLPIRVCAGATLKLPYEGTVEKSPIKLDGSAEAFGKIELPVNQTCVSLSVRDVYESDAWTALPAGTYGSSGSGAEFVRDDLFAGPGVLTVGPAAPSTDVMLLIW